MVTDSIKLKMRSAEEQINKILIDFETQTGVSVVKIQLFREPPTTLLWVEKLAIPEE